MPSPKTYPQLSEVGFLPLKTQLERAGGAGEDASSKESEQVLAATNKQEVHLGESSKFAREGGKCAAAALQLLLL